ncbi:MAG: hypothetical protein JXA28_12085 [Bacteroidetes bacterium]|nr:hypothetical protein [Bacteroidota bacterium]
MKTIVSVSFVLLGIVVSLAPEAHAQIDLDIETGVVFSGYNDVRIPGKGGTLFSLSEELEADPEAFYRIRVMYHFNERHHLGALYAPLSINSAGQLNRALVFEGETFPAKTPLETTFKFNSYRLFYRYDFLRNDDIEIGAGFTAKIRDARIAVSGGGRESEKTNVGFVPIIHFRVLWKFAGDLALLLEGDALAAPQGRAEDVLAAFMYRVSDDIDVKAGYRILEGGADNDEVYNFTLVNYASLGAVYHF